MSIVRKFGKKEIIFGPMGCGKSIELIRRIKTYEKFAKKFGYDIHVFKPRLDNRKLEVTVDPYKEISSRVGLKHEKNIIAVQKAKEILDFFVYRDFNCYKHLVIIEEVMLFDSGIVDVVKELSRDGFYIIVAGLNTSFRGEPFVFADYKKNMMHLMDLFDDENRKELFAICNVCGERAQYTQRLTQEGPAKYYDPLIFIGDQEYEARCERHFEIPGKEEFIFVKQLIKRNPYKKVEFYKKIANVPDFDKIFNMMVDERIVSLRDGTVIPYEK